MSDTTTILLTSDLYSDISIKVSLVLKTLKTHAAVDLAASSCKS